MSKKLLIATLAVSFLASACCWKRNQNAMFSDADMKLILLADNDMMKVLL